MATILPSLAEYSHGSQVDQTVCVHLLEILFFNVHRTLPLDRLYEQCEDTEDLDWLKISGIDVR